jgi:hypothetical protein
LLRSEQNIGTSFDTKNPEFDPLENVFNFQLKERLPPAIRDAAMRIWSIRQVQFEFLI